MTVINISWYLCILFAFAVALAVSSAITVAPAGQAWMRLEIGTWLALAVAFAAVAVIFKRFHVPQPRWLLRVFQGFAVLATLVALIMVGG